MKFAEALEETLVSEWRDKYVEYKNGKRLVKAIQRAVNRTNGVLEPYELLLHPLSFRVRDQVHVKDIRHIEESTPLGATSVADDDTTMPTSSTAPAASIQSPDLPEDASSDHEQPSSLSSTIPVHEEVRHIAFLEDPDLEDSPQTKARRLLKPLTIPSGSGPTSILKLPSTTAHDRATETPKPGKLRRFATGFNFARVETPIVDTKMHPIDIVALRKKEFFTFLEGELEKIETFFQEKETEAGERLESLRQQLHIMRQHRNQEMGNRRKLDRNSNSSVHSNEKLNQNGLSLKVKSKLLRERSNSRTLKTEAFTPIEPRATHRDLNGDFVKKITNDKKVAYRVAKQKLRVAIQELYRTLELLRSYSILNRTAFLKLNKKYEKTSNPESRPMLSWFHEKISGSHFCNSGLVDNYISTLEDLSARYLERGNRKLAAEKLRELTKPKGDKSGSAMLNGLMVGIGLTFAVEGAVLGIQMLDDEDEELRSQAPFLLQLYAGYFITLYLFAWFCFNCRTWTRQKVNYRFIFEFDPRHDLDWRQLSNFPCFFTLVLGVFMWLNFSNIGNEELFHWYPLILIGFTLTILFLPFPLFRWKSRKWFVVAHARLLLSGFYPVEFRDFFLGDIYCSLAYSFSNAELFFCLYARQWNEPIRCSSRYSRLVGFAATIPFIFRSLQCIRRFWDTKNAFPHLANLLKYLLAIAATVALSLFRMDNDFLELSFFIALASISAFYSAFWDLFMDFSLFQGGAYLGLRDVLAFDKPWLYYGIIIIDPILRFSFVLSIIFTHSIQHGTYVAFIIAFTEATRRGMWSLFRVENEHCTNIKLQKASRDMPLPYSIAKSKTRPVRTFAILSARDNESTLNDYQTTPMLESGVSSRGSTTPSRMGILQSLSERLGEVHREDFQKKNSPAEIEEEEEVPDREPDGIERALLDDEGSDNESADVDENFSEECSSHRSTGDGETERRSDDDSTIVDGRNSQAS